MRPWTWLAAAALLPGAGGPPLQQKANPPPPSDAAFHVTFEGAAAGEYTAAQAKADFGAAFSEFRPGWGPPGREVVVVSGAEAYKGGKSLRVRTLAGVDSVQAHFIDLYCNRIPPAEEYWWDFMIKFGEGFDFAVGGKIMNFGGGKQYAGAKPAGDGWSCYWLFDVNGAVNLYTYHMDQERPWGDNGYPARKARLLVPGQWSHLMGHVKLNTGDNRDGIYEFFFNGKPVFQKRDIRFRSGTQAPADQFDVTAFYGGQGDMFKAKRDGYIYYDNFRCGRTRPPP